MPQCNVYFSASRVCRLHGPDCHIMWGYDPAHTDSTRPYTLQEPAEHTEGPHRYAYPTAAAYEEGWELWRALRRDSGPVYLERLVAIAARLAPHAAVDEFRPVDHAPHCGVARELEGLEGVPDGFALALTQMCACTYPGWAPKAGLRFTEQSQDAALRPRHRGATLKPPVQRLRGQARRPASALGHAQSAHASSCSRQLRPTRAPLVGGRGGTEPYPLGLSSHVRAPGGAAYVRRLA